MGVCWLRGDIVEALAGTDYKLNNFPSTIKIFAQAVLINFGNISFPLARKCENVVCRRHLRLAIVEVVQPEPVKSWNRSPALLKMFGAAERKAKTITLINYKMGYNSLL